MAGTETADLVPALLLPFPLLKLGPQGPGAGRAAVLQLLLQLFQLHPLPAGPAEVSSGEGQRWRTQEGWGQGLQANRVGAAGGGAGGQPLQAAPGCLLAQPLLLLSHLAVKPQPKLLQGSLLLL